MFKQSSLPVLTGSLATGLLCFVLAACSGSGRATQPTAPANVVARYGDEALTLSGFEERYVRSVGSREAAAEDSLAEYQDFLERYVDFRLKVMAGEAAGLSQSKEIKTEIETYRANLARPYLLEQEVLEPIIRDLYKKQQELIDASHILIRVDANAAPADTLAAFTRAQALADSLAQGADFGQLAFRHSEDPSARGREQAPGYKGRLGFFGAGRLVQPFEDMAYRTPVGGVSPVFRTEFGYHILLVHDRRAAVDDVHVAHIMVRPQGTPEDSARAIALVEELQARLAAGEDFGALAREYSDDQGSAGNGGDLGFMSYDVPVVKPFKDAAFALEKAGDVSGVVETGFGYHLIKLLDRRPKPSFEAAYSDLKQTAARLPRAQEAEVALARRVMAARGARLDTARVVGALAGMTADSAYVQLANADLPADVLDDVFYTLGDSAYTLSDLSAYSQSARVQRTEDVETLARNLADQFAIERAIDYEAMTLETRDEEFARVMQEFRDGLVLFKLMEDSVWTAAERDSAALVAHYEAHRDTYRFPERTRLIGMHSRSDSLLRALTSRLDAGETLADLQQAFAGDSLQRVRFDTMLVAGPTGSIFDRGLSLEVGAHTEPLPNRGPYVVLVNDGKVPAGPKTFEEARAEVVSQYQQVLEDRLLARLRDRYRVQTYPERLEAAFRQKASDGAKPTASPRAK